MHAADTVVVAGELVKHAALAHRAVVFGTHTQPFVKLVTVDHANETTFNRDIHFFVRRRHHAGGTCFGDQQFIWNLKILDQARRYGAAAGLDAPLPVQQ